METDKALGTIIAAAVIPSALGLTFLYGFAFRLSFFGTVGIPLQWLSLTYLENAGVGSPLLYEVLRTILFASGIFFIVKFVLNGVSELSLFLKNHINSGLVSLLVSFLAFLAIAYHFNHAPCGDFIFWMMVFGLLVGAAAWRLQDESPQGRAIFFAIVVLLYFGGYGIDQAVSFGRVIACNGKRATLTVDSRDYVYFGNLGEFFILREKAEAKYSLEAFPSKNTQGGGNFFQTDQTDKVISPECSKKPDLSSSCFSWLRKWLCNSTE